MAPHKLDNLSDLALSMPKDTLGRRLLWGLLVSVLINLALWSTASNAFRHPQFASSTPITVRRILLQQPEFVREPLKKAVRKLVRAKLIPPRPRHILKPRLLAPLPIIHQVVQPLIRPKIAARPTPKLLPDQKTQPSPSTHNRSLTAIGPTTVVSTVLPGGAGQVGQPVERQSSGEGQDNAVPPPLHEAPAPPATHDAPIRQEQLSPLAHHDEPPSAPPGPTLDAQAERQVLPEIPEDLRQDEYKTSVHATVQIDASGNVTSVTLQSTSGSTEIDRLVKDALKRWHWKPALQAGRPIASAQRFRFDFEVN